MDIGEFPQSMEVPMMPQMPPAIAAQGNIVMTKAEAPKKIVSQAQNQINHMLIASSDKSSNPLEESSTIVARPGDKPINLDMNAFLGDTQKTRKDIDIINDVLFYQIISS